MAMITVKVHNKQQANSLKGQSDGKALAKVTDSEIRKAAIADQDARLLTPYELTRFKPFILLRKKLRIF